MVPRPLPANHRYTRLLFYLPTIGTGLSKIREHGSQALSQPTRPLFYQPTIGTGLSKIREHAWYTRPLFYQPTIGTGLSKIREHAWFPGLPQPTIGIPDLSSTSQPLVQLYPRLGSCTVPRPLPANHRYTRPLFY